MMELAPVIHSRTYKYDFNTRIIVHPMGSDINWMRQRIQFATSSINNMNPETVRWVIAKNGNKTIAGIVCFIRKLAQLSGLSEEEMSKAELFFHDDKQRSTYAFIGFSIKNESDVNLLHLEYKDFWNIFVINMKAIWNRVQPDPIETNYVEYQGLADSSNIELTNPIKEISTFSIYQSDMMTDKAIFDYYVNNLFKKSDFQLYTNINMKDIRKLEGKDCVISTDSNTIQRLPDELKPNYSTATSDNTAKKKELLDNQSQKTSLCVNWKIGLGIIILILALIYLAMEN